MPQTKHQQKSVEVAPFSPFKIFLRHASVLQINCRAIYINATNLLIPHIAHNSTTVACKLLGNDYTDICKTN